MVNKLKEIMSWRLVTELMRRFPDAYDLIEAHPGGGQYDCLMLLARGDHQKIILDINRNGGLHIHTGQLSGLNNDISTDSRWHKEMLYSPVKYLDKITRLLGKSVPDKLPPSTPAIITYRYISDFLAHSINRVECWECRNGYLDTSGYGGGSVKSYFDKFPQFEGSDVLRLDPYSAPKYVHDTWFMLKNGEPVLCLDRKGKLYRTDGTSYNLVTLYKNRKRIWPVICKTALDLLP